MTRLSDAVADMLEPDAKAMIGEDADDALVAAASLAISIKRIADASAPPEDAACMTCRYWFNGVQGDPDHGLCHRRPPLVTGGMMSNVETVRPETRGADFCGDYAVGLPTYTPPPPAPPSFTAEATAIQCPTCGIADWNNCDCVPF